MAVSVYPPVDRNTVIDFSPDWSDSGEVRDKESDPCRRKMPDENPECIIACTYSAVRKEDVRGAIEILEDNVWNDLFSCRFIVIIDEAESLQPITEEENECDLRAKAAFAVVEDVDGLGFGFPLLTVRFFLVPPVVKESTNGIKILLQEKTQISREECEGE